MRFDRLIQLASGVAVIFLSACSSYGVIKNEPLAASGNEQEYSIGSEVHLSGNSGIAFTLSFSGGGTRAAALAYGVMQELRDTEMMINGKTSRLLDEVDSISSVSGGSFTAAYYGLHGDKLFEDFEGVFLRHDFQGPLLRRTLNPFSWFSRKGRTERAIEYYEKKIFHNATYADMWKPGRPLIVINASDLAYGIRFSFVQEYFDLLCSDLMTFPVARAVAASSAVPVLFNPVVVENYTGCGNEQYDFLAQLVQQAKEKDDAELRVLAEGLESYRDKDQRKYIHFVDGGITDNIGLRAIWDVVTISGGARAYVEKMNRQRPSKLVLIAVDASTTPVYNMDATNKQPSMAHSMGAMTGVQLHRYNTATIELLQYSVQQWTRTLSSEEDQIKNYFIDVSLNDIEDPQESDYFNKVPTSFKLSDEQVDRLIEAGRRLLRNHPAYQRLLADLETFADDSQGEPLVAGSHVQLHAVFVLEPQAAGTFDPHFASLDCEVGARKFPHGLQVIHVAGDMDSVRPHRCAE